MSSKGQVVIPVEMRKKLHAGDKLVVIQVGDQIILKSMKKFDRQLEEDLKFAKSVEEGWKEYDRGLTKKVSREEFFKEMEKWFS